ncbi:hypothetical protein BSKO_01333 [Bryopsis sp. KO-2023]|nr:hypothetical protein BSKO_01333 [Bryopsis sp. KO-2023]
MPGTAFNGSAWVTAAEMSGLVFASMLAAAGGGLAITMGIARGNVTVGGADAEINPKRRRIVIEDGLSADVSQAAPAQKMAVPNVVEDVSENGSGK